MKTTKARQQARGEDCMIRIPGVCNGDPETTVLCHYRLSGYCGAGFKPPDTMAAWGCSDCHDLCDGRSKSKEYDKTEIRLMLAEGVIRTQEEIRDKGPYLIVK